MTQAEFLTRLRRALAGTPPGAAEEIVRDYESHFREGLAAGRSEAEVAASLGDPDRLGREHRAEQGLRRWEAQRTPSAAFGALAGVVGLGAFDILVVAPVVTSLGSVVLTLMLAAFGCVFGGLFVGVFGLLTGMPGAPAVPLLLSLGLMSFGVCVGSLGVLAAAGLIRAGLWWARVHLRLVEPGTGPLSGALS